MKGNRLKSRSIIIGLLLVVCCVVTVIHQKINYPFGDRAAVLRSMYFALLNYAYDHDGHFPSSPKGDFDALQKLYPEYAPSGYELAGISGNIEATVAALREKRPLNSSITSWRYWQGFTRDDDPNLAILWESRGGLYANGKRNYFGGHAVLLISGDITNVRASDWMEFVKRQEQLRKTAAMKSQ